MVRLLIVLMMLLLTSCSGTLDTQLCHINANLDYLEKEDSLHELSSPNDIVLPSISSAYTIPNVSGDSYLKTGKNLSICPPNVAY